VVGYVAELPNHVISVRIDLSSFTTFFDLHTGSLSFLCFSHTGSTLRLRVPTPKCKTNNNDVSEEIVLSKSNKLHDHVWMSSSPFC